MKDHTDVPDDLNRIVDKVLAYRPKPKSKGAKKRTRKKKALEKQTKPAQWWRVFYWGPMNTEKHIKDDAGQGVLGFSDSVSEVPESLLAIMKSNSLALEILTKTRTC
jgi:hypothetical protein